MNDQAPATADIGGETMQKLDKTSRDVLQLLRQAHAERMKIKNTTGPLPALPDPPIIEATVDDAPANC